MSNTPPTNKFVLLDRDGVINVATPVGYVTSPDQIELLPGAAGAIAELNRNGYRVIVVSNQQCVGKGLISLDDLNAISDAVSGGVAAEGGAIECFLYCTHLVSDACACRKPKPGLIFDAQRRYGFCLADTYFVGDSYSDLVTAQAAGCKALFVLSGLDAQLYREGRPLPERAVPVLGDLSEAVTHILRNDPLPR